MNGSNPWGRLEFYVFNLMILGIIAMKRFFLESQSVHGANDQLLPTLIPIRKRK